MAGKAGRCGTPAEGGFEVGATTGRAASADSLRASGGGSGGLQFRVPEGRPKRDPPGNGGAERDRTVDLLNAMRNDTTEM